MSKKGLLSTAMVAEITGFTAAYIRRLLLDGKLDGKKVGKEWLISQSQVKRIKHQRKNKGEAHGTSESGNEANS